MPSTHDYTSQPLPFEQDLTGISKKTIDIHHDTLYQGYVNKMIEVGDALKVLSKKEDLSGNQTYSELRGLRMGETFANNGVYLHEYYFDVLGGNGQVSENALIAAITEKWGSVENFMRLFSATGMAMRGWVVLAWDVQLSRLKIYGCDAHNQGGVWGALPVLVLDVYEHAYYLDYGADRKAYIADFWKNLNWQAANQLFEKWQSISR